MEENDPAYGNTSSLCHFILVSPHTVAQRHSLYVLIHFRQIQRHQVVSTELLLTNLQSKVQNPDGEKSCHLTS